MPVEAQKCSDNYQNMRIMLATLRFKKLCQFSQIMVNILLALQFINAYTAPCRVLSRLLYLGTCPFSVAVRLSLRHICCEYSENLPIQGEDIEWQVKCGVEF